MPVGNDKAVSSAKITLRSYNGQSTLPVQLTVATITRASHQVLHFLFTHPNGVMKMYGIQTLGLNIVAVNV